MLTVWPPLTPSSARTSTDSIIRIHSRAVDLYGRTFRGKESAAMTIALALLKEKIKEVDETLKRVRKDYSRGVDTVNDKRRYMEAVQAQLKELKEAERWTK